ncbi:MAG: DUF3499 domain-containing protein [Actinomycetota bacterium]
MSPTRRCSRTACADAAIATLTYVYADQQAVVGPLAPVHEPHCYDLCREHAGRLTAPRGWEVVRRELAAGAGVRAARVDVEHPEAIADAVREEAFVALPEGGVRRGHLRMLPSPAP